LKLRPKITALFFVFLCAGCSADSQNELPDGAADAQDADGAAVTDQDSPDGGDDTADADQDIPDGDGQGGDFGIDGEQDGDGQTSDSGPDGEQDGDGQTADPDPDGGEDADGSNGDPGSDQGHDGDSGQTGCAGYGAGVRAGTIDNFLLYELSGITASLRNSDVLWTHNDGSDPKLYAVGTDSEFLGTYSLLDLDTHDWEDIAVGPGPLAGETYVYVGDHGNNGRDRQRVWVHRVLEPELGGGQPPFDLDLSGGETFPLDYPDDRHDVETLLVDPVTGDVYLVTKAYEGPTILFRAAAPLVDGQAVTLEQMNTIDLGSNPQIDLAKGGDVSPSGDRIVIRTTFNAFIWTRPLGTPFWEAFDYEPCTVGLQIELTGEAAGFAADGASFYPTSEWLNPPLYYYEYSR